MGVVDNVRAELAAGAMLLMDGATGTELERRGAQMHGAAWCATATMSDPDILRAVHEDYMRAGARVITTNTFSTNRNMLAPAGLEDRFEELNRQAVAIALRARDNLDAGARVLVAGSLSHQVPIVRNTATRDQRQIPPPEVAGPRFNEMASLLAGCGVDVLLMEMMSNPVLAVPAIEAARATGLPVWLGYSVRHDEAGNLVSYSNPELGVDEMFDAIPPEGVEVAGIMHSNVSVTTPALEALRRRYDGPVMVYPDSGYFIMPHWQFEDVIPPQGLVEEARKWADLGAQLIGGCCGLGLEHIQALATDFGAGKRL